VSAESNAEPNAAGQPAGPIMAVDDLHKTYHLGSVDVPALNGVSFAIGPGEFVAIIGPSGSGKSTLMNLLGCLDTPTRGRYLFRGVDVGALDRDQRALLRRHYIGFVFQGFNLLARTSALENVELPLVYKRVPARERHARARAALAAVGLSGRETHAPHELSGGQQQRVAIARALVTEPSLLLADEPTGNLDTTTSREILELLAGLNRDRGLTVVMVTHEADVAAWARRRVIFRDGLIIEGGPEVATGPAGPRDDTSAVASEAKQSPASGPIRGRS
jgi:putative ABC transport system ATP-binding protein